jgi:hypothetical protein
MKHNVYAFGTLIALALLGPASVASAQTEPVVVLRCTNTAECRQRITGQPSAFEQVRDTFRARENFNTLGGFINERVPQSADVVSDEDGTFQGTVTFTENIGERSQSQLTFESPEEGGRVQQVDSFPIEVVVRFLYDQRDLSTQLVPLGPDGGGGGGGGGGPSDDCEIVFAEEICHNFPASPIILDLGQTGYELTDVKRGVRFDIDADGALEQVSWTARGSEDAFLALDRNGNRQIDDGGELFGTATKLADGTTSAHGYIPLAELDLKANGGNANGYVDYGDRDFGKLLLWTDRDHDGRSSGAELLRLSDRGIFAIALDADESDVIDEYGNQLAYVSPAYAWRRGRIERIRTTDIFFRYHELRGAGAAPWGVR